jgi:hypothetical protein
MGFFSQTWYLGASENWEIHQWLNVHRDSWSSSLSSMGLLTRSPFTAEYRLRRDYTCRREIFQIASLSDATTFLANLPPEVGIEPHGEIHHIYPQLELHKPTNSSVKSLLPRPAWCLPNAFGEVATSRVPAWRLPGTIPTHAAWWNFGCGHLSLWWFFRWFIMFFSPYTNQICIYIYILIIKKTRNPQTYSISNMF